jgi:hypothetical protein
MTQQRPVHRITIISLRAKLPFCSNPQLLTSRIVSCSQGCLKKKRHVSTVKARTSRMNRSGEVVDPTPFPDDDHDCYSVGGDDNMGRNIQDDRFRTTPIYFPQDVVMLHLPLAHTLEVMETVLANSQPLLMLQRKMRGSKMLPSLHNLPFTLTLVKTHSSRPLAMQSPPAFLSIRVVADDRRDR